MDLWFALTWKRMFSKVGRAIFDRPKGMMLSLWEQKYSCTQIAVCMEYRM